MTVQPPWVLCWHTRICRGTTCRKICVKLVLVRIFLWTFFVCVLFYWGIQSKVKSKPCVVLGTRRVMTIATIFHTLIHIPMRKKTEKTPKAQHRGFVLSFKVSTQGVYINALRQNNKYKFAFFPTNQANPSHSCLVGLINILKIFIV